MSAEGHAASTGAKQGLWTSATLFFFVPFSLTLDWWGTTYHLRNGLGFVMCIRTCEMTASVEKAGLQRTVEDPTGALFNSCGILGQWLISSNELFDLDPLHVRPDYLEA